MLLLIDVGNTRTAVAIHRNSTVSFRRDWPTAVLVRNGSMEIIQQYLSLENRDKSDLCGTVVSSVVPGVVPDLIMQLEYLTGHNPFHVKAGINIGMGLNYNSPVDIGSDRIANAVAAKYRYNLPVLIVDFGTATTLTYVNVNAVIEGGLILPGIQLLKSILGNHAAQLMEVPFQQPEHLIGHSTRENIQSGVFHLFRFGLQGIVNSIRSDVEGTLTVVGTGGFCEPAARELRIIDETVADLTLEGLALLYALNRNTTQSQGRWPLQ